VSVVNRYRLCPCWSIRNGSLTAVLVEVLIRTLVSVVVVSVPVPVSEVEVAKAASAVDVASEPVVSGSGVSEAIFVVGTINVAVSPVTGTETVGTLIGALVAAAGAQAASTNAKINTPPKMIGRLILSP
jgi:hypothetical protein